MQWRGHAVQVSLHWGQKLKELSKVMNYFFSCSLLLHVCFKRRDWKDCASIDVHTYEKEQWRGDMGKWNEADYGAMQAHDQWHK